MTHLRYRQSYRGIPVLGAALSAHFRPDGSLSAINGFFVPDLDTNESPSITGAAALAIAKNNIGVVAEGSLPSRQRLVVYQPSLAQGTSGLAYLAYEITISTPVSSHVVFVDAHAGDVLSQFRPEYDAIERQAYVTECAAHANCGPPLERGTACEQDLGGNYVCEVPFSHLECPSGNDSECEATCFSTPMGAECAWREGDPLPHDCTPPDPLCDPELAVEAGITAIAEFSEDARNLFSCLEGTELNWDLTTDGPMHAMLSTDCTVIDPGAFFFDLGGLVPGNVGKVHVCLGFTGDDVIAHEWAHGYTLTTHGLDKSFQPGALNESFSDIWGEVVDQLNGAGSDIGGTRTANLCSPAVVDSNSNRWLLGEDGVALRDMWTPSCLGDAPGNPGRVGGNDAQPFLCTNGSIDSGGVHTNSSIPNHAFALMVDGGTYNGFSVTALGMNRTANIYWRAQRYYQGPSTTFAEHADALVVSCDDFVATGGAVKALSTNNPTCGNSGSIRQRDCDNLATAIQAVQLCSTTCEPCPAIIPCNGMPGSCSATGAATSTDTGMDRCQLPAGGFFECAMGENIWTNEAICEEESCCGTGQCLCGPNCGTSQNYSCNPVAFQPLCLAYPQGI